MTLVDRLVTEVSLDPRKYEQGAAKVKAAAHGIKQSTSSVAGSGGGVGQMFDSLGGGFSSLLSAIPIVGAAIAGIGAAITGAAVAASNASRSFDLMKRQMAGLLGGMGPAKQMMDWVMAYSQPSMFDFEPLANAAKQLLMAGLDVNRFLPLAEKLAIGMGGTAEDMMDVVSVFRRAVGGQIADAIGPEGIGRAGINRQMLIAEGAKFNAQGQFQGNLEDFFNVVERAARRLQGVQDEVGKSFEAQWANLVTEFKKALIGTGDGVNKVLAPIVSSLTKLISNLNANGTFARIAERLASVLGDGTTNSPLIQFAAAMGAIVKSIPTIIDYMMAGFRLVVSEIIKAYNNLPLVDDLANPFEKSQAADQAIVRAGVADTIQANAASILSALAPGANTGMGTLPLAPMPLTSAFAGQAQAGTAATPAANPLDNIAEYTRQTAENTKPERLKELVMGGAQIGGKGIMQREFGTGRRSVERTLLKALYDFAMQSGQADFEAAGGRGRLLRGALGS